MKNALLILIALLLINSLNAQKHIATAVPAQKIAGFSKQAFTQGVQAACDTLKIDSAINLWSSFIYTIDTTADDGYVLGVGDNIDEDGNGFTVLQDANYYDVSGSNYNYITGGLVDFGKANTNVITNLNKDVIFKVYDDAGGVPGTLLGSANVAFSSIKTNVEDSALTEFKFTTPIAIPTNKIFYISVDHSNFLWDGTTRDSLAIVADSSDQAPAAAYQYLADGLGWYTTNFIWSDASGNPLDVNLYLFPYVSNTSDGACAMLPVSLLNFKGSLINNQANLTWNTATEFNNKGFEVERSNDGKLFTDIGFVKGAGTTSSLKKYTYTDATLSDLNNTFYYRLKQVDLDGKTSYSKVILLSSKSIADWKMYPNPVKDKINISFNLTEDAKVSVQIISKDGKLLMNEDKGTLKQGAQQLSFNIKNIAAGSYFIRIKAGDDAYTQNIIKQ